MAPRELFDGKTKGPTCLVGSETSDDRGAHRNPRDRVQLSVNRRRISEGPSRFPDGQRGPPASLRVPPEAVIATLESASLSARVLSAALPDQYVVEAVVAP